MEAEFVIKNGELIEKKDANVSVYNKSFFFDFVVYSNIKVVQGKMFIPKLEIEKLFESAKTLGIEHEFTKENILKWMKTLIGKNDMKDALVRLLLIGGYEDNGPIILLFPVGLTFYPKKFYNNGVKLVTYQGERFIPTAKSKSLLLNYIAYREAAKKDSLDALLVDKNGNITEGTRTSLFAIKDDTLIAPPAEYVLEGVTRKIILDMAPKIMKVKKESIPLKDITNYDAFFISGTSINIMPVAQINHIVLKNDKWEKIKELQHLFKEYCNDESNLEY